MPAESAETWPAEAGAAGTWPAETWPAETWPAAADALPDEPVPHESEPGQPVLDESVPDQPEPDQSEPDEPEPDEPVLDEPVLDEPVLRQPVPDQPVPDRAAGETVAAWAVADQGASSHAGPDQGANGQALASADLADASTAQFSAIQPANSHRAPRGASTLRLVWVYPDLLSTYGDRGNLLVLERRARLRGIQVESVEVKSDERVPVQGDIYLMGGGEDLPQVLAARRLRADGGLSAAAARRAVIFAVCAGYQVLGAEFGGVDGEPVPGLEILDIRSGRGERRGVGEIVADVDPELGVPRLTGFENHQGVTVLGSGARPLARVSRGVGNGDGTEGAYAGQVVGTYLHGPALVRNPGLADLLLTWAAGPLPPLTAADERWAAQLREDRLAAATA
jgi:lipid II isoglutaminyl synthase (glutamine-hydrolysing)